MPIRERSRNIAVGFTAITGVVILCTLLILFGYVPAWVESGYPVTVKLPSSGGVNVGGSVRLNGIDIGRIESVRLEDDPAAGVVVIAKVRDDITLPDNVRVRIQGALLGGGTSFSFVLNGQPASPTPLSKDGSAVVDGFVASPFDGMTGQFQSMIAGPLERFDSLSDRVDQLAAEWTLVGQNINQLVAPRTVEQVDAGDAVGNVATVIARADARLAEMRVTLEGVNRVVNDEQFVNDIKATAREARSAVGKVNANIEALKTRYVAVADDLSKAITSMQALLDEARGGKGTVGQLMTNPALYNNLNDAAQRLNTAFGQLQRLLERWKAEGVELSL